MNGPMFLVVTTFTSYVAAVVAAWNAKRSGEHRRAAAHSAENAAAMAGRAEAAADRALRLATANDKAQFDHLAAATDEALRALQAEGLVQLPIQVRGRG